MFFKKPTPEVVTNNNISKNNILNDVLEIRRRGDYVPDYNKPKLYQEYVLEGVDGLEVSKDIFLSQERPEDCPSDMDKWLETIHLSHREESNSRVLRLKEERDRVFLFKEINSKYIMSKMMKVY
jgi:hypothetical protein